MSSEVSISEEESYNDDPKTSELLERVDIVDKYDKGSDNQEVDEWENPNFELYRKTDRYGFLHEDEANLNDVDEARAKEFELKRERKWLKMVRDWDKYKHSIKLRKRIFKGIPEKMRSVVWGQLLNIEKNRQPGVYEQLRLRARFLSRDLKQIDLDINRTYRNHIFFRRRYDMKQRALFHVLAAYAMYNTQVGYCQGMSQVAALLLMYFDEEDAFWALHTLMCNETHAMHGFFVPGFPKLLRFQQHHDRILKKLLPKLKKHMDKYEIHSALYSTKWYFQCFLDRVPFPLALRLWDNFMLDGDIVLTGTAYCIMKMHQKTLVKLNFEQTMEFLQIRLEEDFGYPNDIVIQNLRACIAELRRNKLLEPPPMDKAERPTKPFGEILATPLDDIRRSLSVALSRKRNSRAFSLSHSMPVTPQHRNFTPVKNQQQPSSSIAPNRNSYQAESSSTSVSPIPPVTHMDSAIPSSVHFRNSPSVNGHYVSPTQQRVSPLSVASSSTYGKPASVRHVPSYYDNVPPSISATPTNHYASSEDQMEIEMNGGGDAQRAGAFSYTQTGQYSRKSETVTTYVRDLTDTDGNFAKSRNNPVTTTHDNAAMIVNGPNYVTTVEVNPAAEWRYSYGSNASSAKSATSTSRVLVGSQNSLASPTRRGPGKFPIGPTDLWGGGDGSGTPTKSSINTFV